LKNPLPLAALISLLTVSTALWLEQPHPLTPNSAPATEYSGERAMSLLNHLLAENLPHPVGSKQNRVIKQRIQAWLDEQGIDHQEQRAWGCNAKRHSCAYVENVIAIIPGQVTGPYVALMAHYDSVPHAVGAGDDMAGVVAVLETARAARAVGGFRHPIMLLITDGEETGLHGAEAFFKQHPLAAQIGVLLNLEGSGTRGASMVLRTSMANAWYMNFFADTAAQPMGSSLADEVFKRMPNDTDFSVSLTAKIPGIDFSFAGERNHYHTPNDNPENLDPRTVQHHGDNLFPLTLQLANADLSTQHDTKVAYLNSFGAWLQWPTHWTPIMYGLAGVLLFWASIRAGGSVQQILLASVVLPLSTLIIGGMLVHLCMALLSAINGVTVPWPAYLWPQRLIVLSGTTLPALLCGRWLAERFALDTLLVAGWLGVWLLTLPVLLVMPDAAAMLMPQLLLAATLLSLANCLGRYPALKAGLFLGTLAVAALFLPTALLLEQTQGYGLVVTVWPWVGLYVICLLGFLRGPALIASTRLVGAALLTGLVAASVLPVYSEHRPQHLNVLYIQDTDASKAMLHIETEGQVPPAMLEASPFQPDAGQAVPWSSTPIPFLAPVANVHLPAPTVDVVESRTIKDERQVRLRLSSQRHAWRLRLYLPASAAIKSATVDGVKLSLPSYEQENSPSYTGLLFYGTQNHDVIVNLTLASTEPVTGFLVDSSPSLPDIANGLIKARPSEALPVHSGDRSTVFTKVAF